VALTCRRTAEYERERVKEAHQVAEQLRWEVSMRDIIISNLKEEANTICQKHQELQGEIVPKKGRSKEQELAILRSQVKQLSQENQELRSVCQNS